ncbi:hypothetical protein AVV29_gp027 [Vibrio phage phi 3]|uniref:Uncharacterized protein n=1 Tax=Vibrio phage phi 3 TaxID=1589298 RepID=A0A0B5HE50_9CAUD|nr:hypothetical protein AVV29_gp027 [Vibrio phage phi 3]AJF40795.1 hypothetical protein SBVP3_0027 [Vibrio phage phi 3]
MGEIEFVKGGVYCFTSYTGDSYPTLYLGDRFMFFANKSEILESIVRADLDKELIGVNFVGMLEDFASYVPTTLEINEE